MDHEKIRQELTGDLISYFHSKQEVLDNLNYSILMDHWLTSFRDNEGFRKMIIDNPRLQSFKEGNMKKNEVEVGRKYKAKVKGAEQIVIIKEELEKGWLAEDENGGDVKIRAASRIVEEVKDSKPETSGDVDNGDVMSRLEDIEDQLEELAQAVSALQGGKKKAEVVVKDVEEEEEKEEKKKKAAPDSDDKDIKKLLKELDQAKGGGDNTLARKLRGKLRKLGYSLRTKNGG